MLSSLLGDNFLQTLSSVIAQFSGLGQGDAKDLLGLLAPLVLGFLRREQVARGLDSRGLASLLATQRDNIRRAMPAEMATRLQDSGARPASPPAPESFRRPPAPAQRQPSGSWAVWLLPLLILAGVAIYLIPANQERRTVQDIDGNTTTIAKNVPGGAAGAGASGPCGGRACSGYG